MMCLPILLGAQVLPLGRHSTAGKPLGMLGWGRKPSACRAQVVATRLGLPMLRLEDGFLRSFHTGQHQPPLSLVVDDAGIYYDCTQPSALEQLLASPVDVLAGPGSNAVQARAALLQAGLSKYNHAPDLPPEALRAGDVQRVLVLDQTAGDMSVALGGASAQSFADMLQAALDENPQATIYVKTHPEVSSGRKGGYLTAVQNSARVVVLREAVNPLSLIQQMSKVYVVSSTMGFEALLAGKPVTCFGVPWYAGWGVTDDRQPNHPAMQRRAAGTGRRRTVDELFAAGYLHYTRYLNPYTHQRGEMADVMHWLVQQRAVAQRYAGRMIAVGFRRWKAANLRPMLSLYPERVLFVKNAAEAAALQPTGQDCLVCWGRVPPAGVQELAEQAGVRLLRMEDGFVRSVGLGSDLIPPQSFVLDAKGIYFDPGQPSELEDLLNHRACTAHDVERARKVRELIVQHRLTKYNLEPNTPVQWGSAGRQVVLVPGQVEDDASIRFGCDVQHGVHTNLGLLQAARAQFPDAFIVYKPHPDVASGNRKGQLALQQAMHYADAVETQASVVSCVEACDVVVTMTSLTGFDALLRGKRVVVHGRPFYAGWGLTEDVLPVPRRLRTRSLDELVYCALIAYPLYWDPVLKGYTSCEAVLEQLRQRRDALASSGKLQQLRVGYVARQWRKLKVLVQALG
ncbi:capsular polysaccharide biosynthesis protein [Comamonas kerstersii]|uniref:capsular polysaccharide biosynthesis protein n=1 Tax=Comamonas kerstersii TaxID=225992 RepID=UPI00266FE52F|nr:capsular polysaccharide biosynthesis protein [Comamonas kerstersii]